MGAGLSRMSSTQSLFNESPPEFSTLSMGGNLGIYWNLTGDNDPFQFHVGAFESLATQSYEGGQYNLFTTYPSIRIEIFKFYGGASYSPWVWSKKSGAAFSTGNSSKAENTASLNVHAGVLWKATPNFHLAIQAHRDLLLGASSGLATLGLTLQMRLYFFDIVTNKNKRSVKVDGWRYPFGMEIN